MRVLRRKGDWAGVMSADEAQGVAHG
jgi:hypothetical protein